MRYEIVIGDPATGEDLLSVDLYDDSRVPKLLAADALVVTVVRITETRESLGRRPLEVVTSLHEHDDAE